MINEREIIYGQRLKVLAGEDVSESIKGMIDDTIDKTVDSAVGEHTLITEEMIEQIAAVFWGCSSGWRISNLPQRNWMISTADAAKNQLKDRAHAVYAAKEQMLGSPIMRELERVVLLRNVDSKWIGLYRRDDRTAQRHWSARVWSV